MPKWLDNAMFCETYPQSFLDTNAEVIFVRLFGVHAEYVPHIPETHG